jgi:hypothetical protein
MPVASIRPTRTAKKIAQFNLLEIKSFTAA